LAGGNAQAEELALREGGTAACCFVDPVSGELPLHAAARLGQAGALRRLLRCGALVDARTSNGTNATALHLAALAGHGDAVRLLLEAGASPILTDVNGRTAARYAEHAGHTALQEILDDRRVQAGDFEFNDLGRMASKGWADASEAASRSMANVADGMRDLFTGWSTSGASGEGPATMPEPGPCASGAASVHPPQPAQAPAQAGANAARTSSKDLDSIAQRVSEMEHLAAEGHLRGAAGYLDDLTKLACELDARDVTGDAEARTMRRALIARIDRASDFVEQRLAGTKQTLSECASRIDWVEAQVQAEGSGPSRSADECRNRLLQTMADLDAVECANEGQRAARKSQIARIEALEERLRQPIPSPDS